MTRVAVDRLSKEQRGEVFQSDGRLARWGSLKRGVPPARERVVEGLVGLPLHTDDDGSRLGPGMYEQIVVTRPARNVVELGLLLSNPLDQLHALQFRPE